MSVVSFNAGAERIAVVAGGAGFLGYHLCRLLRERGYVVICIDSMVTGCRDNVEAFAGDPFYHFIGHDVGREMSLEGPVDAIFNLACAASPPRYQADPVHTMMTSVNGTFNLLRLAEVHGARFVQASTSEIYGDPEQHPQREDYRGSVNCVGPRACYDEGKRSAETLCFDMVRAGRVDARVARIFNTYGPRMRGDDGRVVSNLVTQALSGDQLTIFGDGSQTRSFCYVSDMVTGLLAMMELPDPPDGAINLGNPTEQTVLELARMVAELVPGAGPVVHRPLPADDPCRRCPDIGKARRVLGWQPRVPIREGLQATIGWFADSRTLGPRAMAS
ncbi:MAG: SDR family oxidoreductase [Rhizobiaceae bacterium]|nr:SDR family oxidoreductase [Rhizobiaceae bacterium]MCV0407470.1 SDR family oxidoreductase [Rhizobiaceae bacterium]